MNVTSEQESKWLFFEFEPLGQLGRIFWKQIIWLLCCPGGNCFVKLAGQWVCSTKGYLVVKLLEYIKRWPNCSAPIIPVNSVNSVHRTNSRSPLTRKANVFTVILHMDWCCVFKSQEDGEILMETPQWKVLACTFQPRSSFIGSCTFQTGFGHFHGSESCKFTLNLVKPRWLIVATHLCHFSYSCYHWCCHHCWHNCHWHW